RRSQTDRPGRPVPTVTVPICVLFVDRHRAADRDPPCPGAPPCPCRSRMFAWFVAQLCRNQRGGEGCSRHRHRSNGHKRPTAGYMGVLAMRQRQGAGGLAPALTPVGEIAPLLADLWPGAVLQVVEIAATSCAVVARVPERSIAAMVTIG